MKNETFLKFLKLRGDRMGHDQRAETKQGEMG